MTERLTPELREAIDALPEGALFTLYDITQTDCAATRHAVSTVLARLNDAGALRFEGHVNGRGRAVLNLYRKARRSVEGRDG